MLLTGESRATRWTIMAGTWVLIGTLLWLHTCGVRDFLALIDAQGLRGAPAASTPRQHVVPRIYGDAQMWVHHALDLQANGGLRVRTTAADNAPAGREVHWSSPLVWTIAAAGHLRHAVTGEPLPLATERSLAWVNGAMLLTLAIALSAWAARRAGAGAGVLVALGMIGHQDFYDGFAPYYVDHHGLITAAAFGTVLGALFMGGGWWRSGKNSAGSTLLPDSPAHARRAAIISAVCGGVGLWFSAASIIPIIALTAFSGLAAVWCWGRATRATGAEFDANLWRLWGRVGALTSLLCYLVEYAPTHFGLRMEVNHPLYALAWWGGAEIVALLAEARLSPSTPTSQPKLRWWWPALAVAAAPLVIVVGGAAVFAVRDPFVGRLSNHVLEGMSLPALVRATGWNIFFIHINEALLPMLPALALLFGRGGRDRLVIGFVLAITLGSIALACWEIRFWQNTSGPQLCLTLMVLAALGRDRAPLTRWLLVFGTAGALFIPNAVTRIRDVRADVRNRTASPLDVAPALNRDIAAALRASQTASEIVLLACPSTSVEVGYYGRFKTIGTLYWENTSGLRSAAEIFCAPNEDTARALMRARGVTHLVLTSDEDFLGEFFSLLQPNSPSDEFKNTFGHRLFFQQQIPVWLRLLPYSPPPDLQRPGLKIFLLQVVPDQSPSEALYHIAAAQLANGDTERAERALRTAFDAAPPAVRADFALKAGNLCYEQGARAAAGRLYRTGLPLDGNATLATSLAWLLATDRDATVRNGTEALALARQVVALLPDDLGAAHALAAALAECGQFPEAVTAGERALTIARADSNAAAVGPAERRLAAYRAGRPWRQ